MYAGKWRDDSDPKADHVGDGGDGDGHGRVLEGCGHPFRNWSVNRSSAPSSQHDEGVVDTDAFKTLTTVNSLSHSISKQFQLTN